MPSKKKKKTKSKRTKSKSGTSKPAKKTLRNKKARRPKRGIPKKQSRKKTASKRPARKRPALGSRARVFETPSGAKGPASGREAGDLQGLSRSAQADSESVDELVEEGNPLEAGVVAGVEEADNEDEREVHTKEFPEDDVPDEYLDKE